MEQLVLSGAVPEGKRDGSGYGYGSGYGDGSGSYWQAAVKAFAARWKEAQRQRLADLQALGQATIAFWWSDEAGRACNGGHSTKTAEPGLVEEIQGPLQVCSARALHATTLPPKWKGSRLWVVALFGEIQTADDKLGALKREIIGECI